MQQPTLQIRDRLLAGLDPDYNVRNGEGWGNRVGTLWNPPAAVPPDEHAPEPPETPRRKPHFVASVGLP